MEAAQEQVKEAYARALNKNAFVVPGIIGHYANTPEERKATPRSGFWRGAGAGTLGGLGGAILGSAVSPELGSLGALGGTLYGGYAGGKSAAPTEAELKAHQAAQKLKAEASQEKTAAMPRIRMARDVRRAAARAAGAAKGSKAAKGVAEAAKAAKGMDKKKLLKGVAAVGTAGGVGAAVGHKKGKTKGRREGFGVGVRRGYVAGAQRGYAAGRSYSKTASFS